MLKLIKWERLKKKDLQAMVTIGLLIGGLFTGIFLFSLQSYIKFLSPPQKLTIQEAVNKVILDGNEQYVVLTDAEIDCSKFQNIQTGYKLGHREFVLPIVDSNTNSLIIANNALFTKCQSLLEKPLQGTISKIRLDFLERLLDHGFSMPLNISSENIYLLCVYCGPDNSLGLMGIAGVFVAFFGYLFLMGWYRLSKKKYAH